MVFSPAPMLPYSFCPLIIQRSISCSQHILLLSDLLPLLKKKCTDHGTDAPLLNDSLNEDTFDGAKKENNLEVSNVKLSDGFKLPFPFWLLTISCVVVYGCVLPFNNIASSLLIERNYFMEQPNGGECTLLYQGRRFLPYK